MHRRRFLGGAALSATILSGCITAPRAVQPAAGGMSLPVAQSELVRGAPKDAIPAIVDPVFDRDWSGLEVEVHTRRSVEPELITPRLTPSDRVIGVFRDGEARAYPLRVLTWHEIVNDDFGGPLLVTFCPLCRTALTAIRTVNGHPTVFGVSGLLYKSNLVMYDEATNSLWSQVFGQAIRGDKTGTQLEPLTSTITTWKAWRDSYPDSFVLRPPPESSTVRGDQATRNYSINPYAGYDGSRKVGIRDRDVDDRLHPKTLIIGITDAGIAKAYPLSAIQKAGGIVNDRVGNLPVVVAVDGGENLVAYDRRVEGNQLRFDRNEDNRLSADGSRWSVTTGEALDGPYEGTRLDRANERPPMFWFSWADLHPDSVIYGE